MQSHDHNHQLDSLASGLSAYLLQGSFASGGISTPQNDMKPCLVDLDGCGFTDAGIGASDHTDLLCFGCWFLVVSMWVI
jgi:hypothetical protein